MFKTIGSISRLHLARDQIRRKYFRIFDFRFRFGDTANFVYYGECWQHLINTY